MKLSKVAIIILATGFSLSTYAAEAEWGNAIALGNTGITWQTACNEELDNVNSIDFRFTNVSDQDHCVNYKVEKPGDGAGKMCIEAHSSKITKFNHNGNNGCKSVYIDWDVVK